MLCSSTWPWTVTFQILCRGQGTVPSPLSRAEHLRAQTMDSSLWEDRGGPTWQTQSAFP